MRFHGPCLFGLLASECHEGNYSLTFALQGDQTEVTWTMTGKNNYVAKIFCLFMNMDTMIGGQFEKGLAELKTAAEKPAP